MADAFISGNDTIKRGAAGVVLTASFREVIYSISHILYAFTFRNGRTGNGAPCNFYKVYCALRTAFLMENAQRGDFFARGAKFSHAGRFFRTRGEIFARGAKNSLKEKEKKINIYVIFWAL